MKRLIASLMAAAVAFTSAASLAFIVPAASESTKQVQLIAVMPVDVQTTNPGVKSYTEIVDTTKIYQANDLITVAAIVEMKNLAKNTLLTSVAGNRIDIRLSSTTIDLSYGMLAPSVVYNIYGANNWGTSAIATNTIAISGATSTGSSSITYDASTGTVTLKVKAVDNETSNNYYMNGAVSGLSGAYINQGMDSNGTYIGGSVQAYAPFNGYTGVDYNSGDPCVWLPAINSSNWNDYVAPTAVQYALIMTGITKPATTGDMKAEMLVTAAEEFTSIDTSDAACGLYWSKYRKYVTGASAEAAVSTYPSGERFFSQTKKLSIGNTYTILRHYDKVATADGGDYATTLTGYTDGINSLTASYSDGTHTAQSVATSTLGYLGVTRFLLDKGYTFSSTRADLGYRYRTFGTMEIFQIYKYDADASQKCGDFIVNLITEATDSATQTAKGLWAADIDYRKLSYNENKYYYASDDSLVDTTLSRTGYTSAFATAISNLLTAAYSTSYTTGSYYVGTTAYTGTSYTSYSSPTANAAFSDLYAAITGGNAAMATLSDYNGTGVRIGTPATAVRFYPAAAITGTPVLYVAGTGSAAGYFVDSALTAVASSTNLKVMGAVSAAELTAMQSSALLGGTGYRKSVDNTLVYTAAEAFSQAASFYATTLLYNSGDAYDDDAHGVIAAYKGSKSSYIVNALAFFAIPLGVNNTSGVKQSTFTAIASASVWSEAVTNTYSYGTITIIEDVVDEGTEEEIIEEEVLEEELPDEEEFVDEFIEEEETIVVPSTGDYSANIALAILTFALTGVATLVFVMKKRA